MKCALCGRSILTRPKYLTIDYETLGTMPFCEDADGCRRMAYERLVRSRSENATLGVQQGVEESPGPDEENVREEKRDFHLLREGEPVWPWKNRSRQGELGLFKRLAPGEA